MSIASEPRPNCRPGCGARIKTKGRSPAREVGKSGPLIGTL